MGAKRDSLEVRAQIIMNMYGDYATDDERAVLQGCIDGAGSLLTMEEVDAKSAELDELRSTLEDAKREALEAAAVEAEAAEAFRLRITTPAPARLTRLLRITRTARA